MSANPVIEGGSGLADSWAALSGSDRKRIAWCAGWVVLLTLLFSQPLWRLAVHAAAQELHSHILLVPFVVGYLLYIRRRGILSSRYSTSIAGTLLGVAVALTALAGLMIWRPSLSVNDSLGLSSVAYVSSLAAGGFLFLGAQAMRAAAFPVAFLLFLIPLPDAAVFWLERGSVLASTEVAALLFQWTGTPMLRDGTFMTLPGIVLEVAQECSGIRSSWVLFITSVVASHLFLQTSWRRVVLVAFVIPLGIVRNGFRILVIGLLCVHVGPHMAESAIHRRGGPIFFVLSLVPLFALLVWLRRREQRLQSAAQQPQVSHAAA